MLQPKPNIAKLAPGIHGSIDYRELEQLGISPASVLDFSVSTNPFGPPPGIREALDSASIELYPDSESAELTQLLAKKLGLPRGRILVGSGSTELIRLVVTVYLGTGDLVLIPQITYAEYEVASHIVSAEVLKQPMRKKTNFRLEITETINLLRRHQPQAIFLCNPNNPTGQYLSREEVIKILSIARDSLIIIDEAYIAFTEDMWTSTDLVNSGNLVILRSMTKDYALAGLRLGYAVSAEPIISVLKRVRPPWNVSAVAQKAGIIALNADDYLEECKSKIREARQFLVKELTNLGLPPLPSQTNFFLVEVGPAAEFRQALLRKGILVRDGTSFGLPDYIRLAPRTLPECRKLITAIKETGVYRHAR